MFFCLPELDYLAIDRWQLVDGFPQQFMSLCPDVLALRVVDRARRLPGRISHRTVATVDRNFVAIALLAQDHKRRVDRNPRKPGGEAGSSLEIPDVTERVQEGVLERILSILTIPGESISGLKNPVRMALTEYDKRVRVSRFSSGRQHLIAHFRRAVFNMNTSRWHR
jgi:hypothetical protein